jgi:hypothetical protein
MQASPRTLYLSGLLIAMIGAGNPAEAAPVTLTKLTGLNGAVDGGKAVFSAHLSPANAGRLMPAKPAPATKAAR